MKSDQSGSLVLWPRSGIYWLVASGSAGMSRMKSRQGKLKLLWSQAS